jgi:hypothetical protein
MNRNTAFIIAGVLTFAAGSSRAWSSQQTCLLLKRETPPLCLS